MSRVADRIRDGSVKVLLQGSYRNSTNIRGDSDVDVVVELRSCFRHNADQLPPEQQQAHGASYSASIYDWPQFRNDVANALTSYYGTEGVDVSGSKSLKVRGGAGRLDADVVPALLYKKYSYFRSSGDFGAEEGIFLRDIRTGREIINYPEQHYSEGAAKMAPSRTNGWFKPTVRILKNARTRLADVGALPKSVAPSYFLQCLLFNVPDSCFGASYQQTVWRLLQQLSSADLGGCVCQNRLQTLFGPTPEQWNEPDARRTVSVLIDLWNGW